MTRAETGGWRLASPATAVAVFAVLLLLALAGLLLAGPAHQAAGSGGLPLGAVFGVAGFVVAWRRPRIPLGWLMLAAVLWLVVSGDAGLYAVASYRFHHGGLPFSWVAVLLQPGWAPAIVLFGLVVLLFPDGRLPSPRWRWLLWTYLAVAALWIGGAVVISAGAIIGRHIQVDSGGNLLALNHPAGASAWWGSVQGVFFGVLGACWLASVAGLVVSYRRSSGERRLQLKWLVGGSVIAVIGGLLQIPLSGATTQIPQIAASAGLAGVLALPVSMGIAILKYRLYDIDRIISRTLAYALVTGLLIGVYAGLVTAASVLTGSSALVVAASTLVVAALFSPLRRRVQRLVDRRFNRARYDADRTVALFAGRLRDSVDLDAARGDLADVVGRALEPAHLSVWIAGGRP